MHPNGGTEAPRYPKKTGNKRAQMLSEKSQRDEIRAEDRLTLWDGCDTRPRPIPMKVLTSIRHQESKPKRPKSLCLLCSLKINK